MKKTPTYNMTWPQLEAMKMEERQRAIDETFGLLMAVPLLVLRDKYGFGAKRLEQFAERVAEVIRSIESGHLDLDDALQTVQDETGVQIKRAVHRWRG